MYFTGYMICWGGGKNTWPSMFDAFWSFKLITFCFCTHWLCINTHICKKRKRERLMERQFVKKYVFLSLSKSVFLSKWIFLHPTSRERDLSAKVGIHLWMWEIHLAECLLLPSACLFVCWVCSGGTFFFFIIIKSVYLHFQFHLYVRVVVVNN